MNISDITVIVSVKNEEKSIPRLLAALPPEVKVCLVDVGSDETEDLVRSLRRENTTVIRFQPRIQEARNYASVQAQTRWLLFTQVDAVFAPGTFSHLAEIHPRGALYGARQSANEQQEASGSPAGWMFLLDRLGIPMVSGWILLVEKYVFHAVGGFTPHLPDQEDTEIGFRIKRAGYRVRYDPALRALASDDQQLPKNSARQGWPTLVRSASSYLKRFWQPLLRGPRRSPQKGMPR